MKGQIIKKRCLKYRLECIGLIIVIFIVQLGLSPKIVRADESVSLAEYVLTLFASMGVGISDETILNAMVVHMNIDINSDPASIQSAITQCENSVGKHFITDTFKSDTESTQDYVEVVGDENINGLPDYSATASENISASIDNYKNFGFASIVEGGKRLALSTPLVQIGRMLGDIASIGWDKFIGWAGGLISGGIAITEQDLAGENGYGVGSYRWDNGHTGSSPYYFCTNGVPGVIVGHWQDRDSPYIWIVNNSSSRIYYVNHYHDKNGGAVFDGHLNVGNFLIQRAYGTGPSGKAVWGGVYGDPNAYIGQASGPVYSPDIITPDGNAGPGKNRPTFSHNSEKPYLKPIDLDLYLIWAAKARENTQNGNTGEGQGDDFSNLVIPFFKPQLDIDGIPQGTLTDPNPVYPAQPTYIPYPTNNPVASPTPATEVAPAPTMTPQELDQELEGNTVRNLGNVFPFCIPFDIVNLFKRMYVPRKAPVITWETNFGQFGDAGTITIDFSIFDPVASVCRTFELILFILGLMIATKNLIGWGG